jgi:copper chaperone CopZ
MTDSRRTAATGTLVRMQEVTLLVEGMGCRRCVREVSRRLRDVPGGVTVEADAASTRVRLTGTMELEEVLGAFVGTAYRPTPATQTLR